MTDFEIEALADEVIERMPHEPPPDWAERLARSSAAIGDNDWTLNDIDRLVESIDAEVRVQPTALRSWRSQATDVAAGILVIGLYGVIVAWKRMRG